MSNNNSTLIKKCSKCKIEQPITQFSKKSRLPDGLNGQCKACSSASWQRYYAKHHDKMLERAKQDKATRPKPDPAKRRASWARNKEAIAKRRKAHYAVNEKLREENRERAKKWVLQNLDSHRRNAREYYKKNRDERKKKVRAYELANPEKVKVWGRLRTNQRRARLSGAGGKYTQADVLKLYKLQRGKCANCRVDMNGKYHTDHRLAVVLGGSNDPHNIELLCPTCNMRKSGKLPHIFAQEEGRLI